MGAVSTRYDCADARQREDGLVAAVNAVQQGQLVVLPTDTVYGLGADAFTPAAVTALLAAKGRGRNMPPPVLVGSVRASTHDQVRVQIAGGDGSSAASYPPPSDTLTAGEWNRAAAANNRIEIRLH